MRKSAFLKWMLVYWIGTAIITYGIILPLTVFSNIDFRSALIAVSVVEVIQLLFSPVVWVIVKRRAK